MGVLGNLALGSIVGRPSNRQLARVDRPELLDRPDLPADELAHNLRDIRRVNRYFGGTAVVMAALPGLIAEIPADRPVTLLDLATGSADIPIAIVGACRQRGRAVEIVATDISPDVLANARAATRDYPEIRIEEMDARAIPLPDRAVDIALCSLALHHLPPAEATSVLREMNRVSAVGFIVNDLVRSRRGYLGAWTAAHLTTTNRLTRHDAPLSVERAYTPAELDAMLADAGVCGAAIRTHPWFRMSAVMRRNADCLSDG